MGSLAGGFTIIGLSLLIGLAAVFFILTIMRTHRLVVRSPDSNRVIGYYLCNEWKDKKDGSTWWKSIFFQKALKIPKPPDEVVYINQRGKCWVEVYELSSSEYCYIVDKGLNQNDVLMKEGKTLSKSFKPFTTVQRQVIVNQFVKAENMRQHSFLKENAMNLAALGFMFIIIVLGVIYSAEIFQGINSVQGGAGSMIREAGKVYQGALTGAKDVAAAGNLGGTVVQNSEKPPR